MILNKKLENAVTQMMAEVLMERDHKLKFMADGEVELAQDIIRNMGKIYINEDYKVRHHFSRFIGYGYDFSKESEDGVSARKRYENAVKNTRERVLGDRGETLIHEEIKDNLGLYLTQI